MPSILGPYYSPHHWYQADADYIRDLQPAWILLHQPSARAIHLAYTLAPHANIILRSWDIDDHNNDRKNELYTYPIDAAHTHMSMWDKKVYELKQELGRNSWKYDQSKWYLQLVNEPDPNYVPQVVTYTLEAMDIALSWGHKLAVVVSSVGTFSKPGEDNRGWALVKPLEDPINEGGHVLCIHEYWQPEGPNHGEDAGNLAWRHRSIPLNVPIVIGEAGANGYIYGRYSKEDDSGWQKTVKDAGVYAAQVKEYIEGCDSRVVGVLLYMLDFHSDQWWSFNTGPASQELLAIKDTRPKHPSPYATQPTQQPYTTFIPSINGNVPEPTFIAPTPQPQPQGDWPRIYAFIKRWEGGYSDNPNDPGGVTNKGITISTWQQWQREHGQVGTVESLKGITDAEAERIFYEWYYLASGADKLAWPLSLAHTDTAVNAGVGRAQEMLFKSKGNFLAYMGHLIDWYTRIDNFNYFGQAWIRRRAEILLEASKGTSN